jgi:hypothetical protein
MSISERPIKAANQTCTNARANTLHGVGGKEGDKRSKHLDGEPSFALSCDPHWKRLKEERLNYWTHCDAVGQNKGQNKWIIQIEMPVTLNKNKQDDAHCNRDDKTFEGNPPTEGPRRSLPIALEMRLDPVH